MSPAQRRNLSLLAASLLLSALPVVSSLPVVAQQAGLAHSDPAPRVNAVPESSPLFASGNIVVTVEGCGVHGGTCTNVPYGTGNGSGNSSVGGYGDNQAAPLTLFQYKPTGTASAAFINSLVLPQSASGANVPVSGEYGSSSEASIQLSGGGQYLTVMGYGVPAEPFDQGYYPGFAGDPYGAAPSGALGQSGSLTGQSYTSVPRVLTLIDANGNINTATAVYNIYNTNNPRSAYTLTGSTAYLSGQGSGSDATGGVFYVPIGAADTAPTAITGLDTSSNTIAQDTRFVQIYNNTLYISVDSKEGSGNARSFVGTLGTPPATSLYMSGAGPTMLSGYGNSGGTGKVTITTGANSNGNNLNAGLQINTSPENYFFASASVLYVADGGDPKNNSANSSLGDGGLQKWINSKSDGTGTWSLAYTLYKGLNLIANSNSDGVSGLFGLAGTVSGNNVLLYTTSYTLSDLDVTYLYGITDNLTYTTASQAASETFATLDTAPLGSNFKGVSLAPTIPNGDVEITSIPSGLAFTSSGTGCAAGTYTTPVTLTWTPASSCTLSVVSQQSAQGVTYGFTQWDDASTNPTRVVTAPATTATYAATFLPVHAVSFSSVAHNFGSLSVGASTSGSSNYGVQVTNTSASTLTYTGVTLSGSSAFSVYGTNCGTSLAAGKSCEIIFSFAPTAPGTVSANWSLAGTPAGTAFNPSNGGTLSGTGISVGAVTLTTAKHNFGLQTAGTSSATFGAVLTNSTSATVAINIAAPTGNTADFTTTANNCGSTLKAGGFCNLQYKFTPTTTGVFSEFIGITANGGATPVTVGGTAYSGLTLVGTGN
jgi:hypothetical protein